jgi:DNA mismatch repair protein MSH6
LQGGENGASPTLKSLIQSAQQTSPHPCRLEVIRQVETFPNSTAIDDDIRRKMQRKTSQIKPWDVPETLEEIHRRKYYSAASKKQQPQDGESSVSRWPNVLRAAVEGNAELALSSFGAALFYLQRNLIDAEILSMQKVKAYIPPTSSTVPDESVDEIRRLAEEQNRQESAIAEEAEEGGTANVGAALYRDLADSTRSVAFNEGDINHLALDGTTVRSLELLCNTADNKSSGSLWSKIDHTVTPSGRRLLRAWLLRPLFRKADIDRRADAVEELSSGANAVAAGEARKILSKVGDIERLLSRVHSMSGTSEAAQNDDEDGGPRIHPNDRAILYEKSTYTKVRSRPYRY